MPVLTFLKRGIQLIILLAIGAVALLTGLYTYIDSSPEAQERIKVSVEDVEGRVDPEAGFMTKATALVASWWSSDEIVAEKRTETALSAKAAADERKEEESRRFNAGDSGFDGDYYPGT